MVGWARAYGPKRDLRGVVGGTLGAAPAAPAPEAGWESGVTTAAGGVSAGNAWPEKVLSAARGSCSTRVCPPLAKVTLRPWIACRTQPSTDSLSRTRRFFPAMWMMAPPVPAPVKMPDRRAVLRLSGGTSATGGGAGGRMRSSPHGHERPRARAGERGRHRSPCTGTHAGTGTGTRT